MAGQVRSQPMIPAYKFAADVPTAEEYIHIRTVSGLTPPPAQAVAAALANSVHCVVVRTNPQPQMLPGGGTTTPQSKLVGMVRLIGDGAVFCQVVDMAVDPDHQRRGLGKRLLDDMIAWIDANAPNAYVSLIGDPPGQRLYRSRGFVDTVGIGMKRSTWGG